MAWTEAYLAPIAKMNWELGEYGNIYGALRVVASATQGDGDGWGATYNPKRKAALELMQVVDSLDTALDDLEKSYGKRAKIVVTGAHGRANSISSARLGELFRDAAQPYLLLFGTGWGMTEEIFSRADYVLEPIRGRGSYNHLSVRSAAAIILDRLLGER